MYLIVGLGNPGSQYENTRHNVGFEVIKLLCQDQGAQLQRRGFHSSSAQIKIEGKKILLLCPLTYMNLSGEAVKACVDNYGLESESIVVVHDDMDLPVGRIKVVRNSGAGGHKGVQSIIAHLGGRGFIRIKIGIGRPRYDESIIDYVLAPFYSDQGVIMEEVFRTAAQACGLFVLEGIEPAMNKINSQNLANKEEGNKCWN